MIRKRCGWFAVLSRRVLRASGAAFLLSLPVAYIPDSTTDEQAVVGVYGGGGQVASIIRDCSGNPIATTANGFGDVSGMAAVVVPLAERSHLVLAGKAGYLRARVRFAWPPGGSSPPNAADVDYRYFNPSIAWESQYVGLGVGAVFGDVPVSLNHSADDDDIPISGHLRFGQIRKVYFNISLMENLPLASGGGLFDAGLGYSLSENFQMYSALSVGFYEQPGFLQQARVRLGHRVNLDLAGRVGEADGVFEYGLSAGVVFRIGGN